MGFHIKYALVALVGVFMQIGAGYAYCENFANNCPEGAHIPSGYKCKAVASLCPNDCSKYEICDPSNGETEYIVTGSCHLENNRCIENEVDCSVFNINVVYGEWTCDKNSQTGQAYWSWFEDAWDTSECHCSVTNKQIDIDAGNTVTRCDKANAHYVVKPEDKYKTKKLTDSVYYTPERQYCSKCHAGYLPHIESSPNDGVYILPAGVSSSYGVRLCDTTVVAPNYAPGCDIPYPLNSTDVPGTCAETCPENMATFDDGATSENDCLPTGAVTYNDSTGAFRLGTNVCD